MNKKVDDLLVNSVMNKLKRKKINVTTASILLGVTERQIYRIIKKQTSPPNTNEKKARKSPQNKTDEETINKIIELYKTKYWKFSYIHFHEKLVEKEQIHVNLKTVERILMKECLLSPFATKKTKKTVKKILQSNNQTSKKGIEQNLYLDNNIVFDTHDIHNRYHHIEDFGALIQLDARQDFYIEEEKWTLHLAIDVASGVFVGAFFDKEETLNGYQHVLHQIITKYGIPKCILTDNRTVFEYLRKGSNQESKNTLIQFKYSCIQFGIKLNTTSVATYKSIIERANGTFGRRTPQELLLENIKEISLANKFLMKFLDQMNDKFSRDYPGKNVFRQAPDLETINNFIGSIAKRVFDKAACIRIDNNYYYATVHNKIVAFTRGTKALIINTFDNRKIIVVDSVSYKAVCINDYEISEEKQTNPDNELFIESHRVNPVELYNYKRKHVSNWNYNSFEKYVCQELEFINRNY